MREGAIGEGAFRGGVDDFTERGFTFGFGDGPGLRGSGNKHLAAGRTDAVKRIPIDGSGGDALTDFRIFGGDGYDAVG